MKELPVSSSNTNSCVRVLLFVVPYVVIVGLFQLFGGFITGNELSSESANATTEQHLITSLFGFLGTFLVVYVFVKWVDKIPLINIGFHLKNHLKDLLLGLIAGVAIMALGYFALDISNEFQFVKTDYKGGEFFLTILVFLLVSVSEEMLFRGYVLRNLMGSMNKFLALIISAILFALLHAANPNLSLVGNINLFLAGILLGLPYIYTKNLMFPIAFHFSWNFFQSIFGFNVSGLDSYSMLTFQISDKNIWNGGDFGFEGSILAIFLQTVSIYFCFVYFKNLKGKGNGILAN